MNTTRDILILKFTWHGLYKIMFVISCSAGANNLAIALCRFYIHNIIFLADRADTRLVPSQWETTLFCNVVSHWLGTSLESPLAERPPPSIERIQQPEILGVGAIPSDDHALSWVGPAHYDVHWRQQHNVGELLHCLHIALSTVKYLQRRKWVNSLVPGRCGNNFKSMIFKLTVQNSSWSTGWETALRIMPHNLINDKSTLVQVMAWSWCRQTTSHYLSQYWPSSMSPYGITRHNNILRPELHGHHFADKIFISNIFYWLKIIMVLHKKHPIDKKLSIGLGSGLATNTWQTIIWTNVYQGWF